MHRGRDGILCCRRHFESSESEMNLVGAHSTTDEDDIPRKDYESLDYDSCDSHVLRQVVEKEESWSAKNLEFIRWVVTFLIGILTALVAVFIDLIVSYLNNWKFATVDKSIIKCSEDGCLVVSLLVFLLFNASFAFIASALVSLEPIAAGSGIPEIKCYLNGVKIPRVVRFKTLVCKAVGVLFSVAGGLFVGKEGPMIHSGAIIGAGVPQFQSITFKKLKFNFPYFRTDRDKRDFVSGGAAAGVAAAFGAPIGGVLFSLEEGSSFWNQSLTWRTFFCAMSATFTLNFILSGIKFGNWGGVFQPGLIDFGIFQCGTGKCNLWSANDLLIFIAMGFVGGLLGALFNSLNKTLTRYRLRHVCQKKVYVRILEAVLIAMVTTFVAFLAAMTLGVCKKIPEIPSDNHATQEAFNSTRNYFCQDGYYNDMATLFFNPQEVAIKQLFHQEGIFFMVFFFLACWTYGAMVPSGLFVPCLLCGAAYGRFVGNVLNVYVGYKNIYTGTFALMGSAAFLGGVVRMTISLTVILIESTNEISYGLPIMVVLMVAKWSGDLFNRGLYDIHIDVKGVPLLEWDAPKKAERLHAHQIMDTDLSYIYPHTRVRSIINMLRTTAHHAFPVVTEREETLLEPKSVLAQNNILYKKERTLTRASEQRHRTLSINDGIYGSYTEREHHMRSRTQPASQDGQQPCSENTSGVILDQENATSESYVHTEIEERYRPLTFHGLVLRSHLVVLLENNVYYPENMTRASQPEIDYETLTKSYPRYPDIQSLNNLHRISNKMIMDVEQYMTSCPYTILPESPVTKVFQLFRTMGLRHLPVVNSNGEILGMITRHNLTEEFLEKKLHQHQHYD
ncbi:chloride transport protein 6-like isoform X2 [Anneissia japonica]|uniref:chloride transport protein 6-like isoform X2 n=1 Tax=Anneissia japonica TaxID=1529436 RepID=UPI001425B2F7|nr:chloride transport protein 6-like isoform X2 [Anneissia japonica]